MRRIRIRIGKLVVHGSEGFAAPEFEAHLRQELGRRIASGAAAGALPERIQRGAVRSTYPVRAAAMAGRDAPRSGEAAAAAAVAARLLE